jgi:hypothetical protein
VGAGSSSAVSRPHQSVVTVLIAIAGDGADPLLDPPVLELFDLFKVEGGQAGPCGGVVLAPLLHRDLAFPSLPAQLTQVIEHGDRPAPQVVGDEGVRELHVPRL